MHNLNHRPDRAPDLTRIAVPVLLLALTGCASSGIGTGSTRNNDVSAAFSWKSTNDRTGALTASLSDGATYTGTFFQINSESRIETLGPLWGGWNRRWGGWSYWNRAPNDAFITHYSGKVVANLVGPDSQHMRCKFDLVRPSSGMQGGGQGTCQLPTGRNIDATFPHS